MTPTTFLRLVPAALLVAIALPGPLQAQDLSDEQLQDQAKGFQQESLLLRLQQVAALLAAKDQAFSALVARIHGDHREYNLKIEKLLDELSDERWTQRESAERTLVEIGGRARTLIQQRAEKFSTLEESIRCKRVLQALTEKGTEQEEREIRLLRGLVLTALYLGPDPRLLRSLRSALGHTDAIVVDGAIRALGAHGGDEEADAIRQMLTWKGGIHRQTTLAALARLQGARALAICRELLLGKDLNRTEACMMIRTLRTRSETAALLQDVGKLDDPVVAGAARLVLPAPAAAPAKARFLMPDRSNLDAPLLGFLGDTSLAADAVPGLPRVELSFGDCDTIDFPEHAIGAITGTRLFLNQGSLVIGELVAVDPEAVKLISPIFGELTLPRREVQGLALDPTVDRLVGASTEHDRVRLKTNEFLDGTLQSVRGGKATIAQKDGAVRDIPLGEIAGLLFVRPRNPEQDNAVYVRTDLTTGDRLIGFPCASSATHLGLAVPLLGAAAIPMAQVSHVELGVGGGALWGFTLIADYSDNRIVEVDERGNIVFQINEVFGAWDAECLDNGNLLITEFSVSRVQEVDRKGRQVWVFEDLKNPYDADRLPNGNTLIADTFGSRVIEVDAKGQIVWKFDKEIRPFDCDRLPNGNTLIADVLKDRVIEVSPEGEVVWEVKGMNNVHDADRLPNGNTLVTLRSKGSVVELDRDGKIVWELGDLSSPSDADRLPNGNTVVAENTQVREFDRRGNVVWRKEMTWAVEVNRY
jgi:hypothetical protein